MLWTLCSGEQTGADNMAWDDLLLDWVREMPAPAWVVRTYQWVHPTLSYGIHQPQKDLAALDRLYQVSENSPQEWVKRPTGGRAILHGEDIAFSFITNDPALLRLSLQESYGILSGRVKTALIQLGLSVQTSGETDEKAYLRSAVCFETHTHSDIVDSSGQKIAGSAQCRRAGGLLQHGSAFINQPLQAQFSPVLFDVASSYWQCLPRPWQIEPHWEAILAEKQRAYQATNYKESAGILENASTT